MTKKRLLALLLSVLMALTIMTVAVSAQDSENVIEISNTEQLSDAIAAQQAGQTWKLKAGTYTLTQSDLDKYASWAYNGQGGWYFPIHEDNITIIGEDGTVITSDVVTVNGIWQHQDFISVWGDNVTIDNVDILSKSEQNKAIEIMSKNFVLKNSTIKQLAYPDSQDGRVFSGSVFFNPLDSEKNIGNSSIENVYLYAYVSASYAQTGTLNVNNLTMDFTNSMWSEWGEGYGPAITGNVYGTVKDVTYIVDNDAIWNELVNADYQYSDDTKPGTVIKLAEDIEVDKMLDISRSDVTIDLNGHEITASANFTGTFDNNKHLVNVSGKNVTVKNGTLTATNANKHVLNVYGAENFCMSDLVLDHTNAFTGAPLVVNGSSVISSGKLRMITGENSWYSMNIDNKVNNASVETKIKFEDSSVVEFAGENALGIFMESTNAGTLVSVEFGKDTDISSDIDGFVAVAKSPQASDAVITNPENANLETDENGNMIIHTHSFSTDWKNDENGHWKECECGEKSEYAEHSFEWIIDKEATATEQGSRHQQCTVCGYKTASEVIPATGSNTDPDDNTPAAPEEDTQDKPDDTVSDDTVSDDVTTDPSDDQKSENEPDTGDNNALALWFILLAISGTALISVVFRDKIISVYKKIKF